MPEILDADVLKEILKIKFYEQFRFSSVKQKYKNSTIKKVEEILIKKGLLLEDGRVSDEGIKLLRNERMLSEFVCDLCHKGYRLENSFLSGTLYEKIVSIIDQRPKMKKRLDHQPLEIPYTVLRAAYIFK